MIRKLKQVRQSVAQSSTNKNLVYRVTRGDPWGVRAPRGDNQFDIANPSDPIFTLYTGESEEAALAEVLAHFRPSLAEIALINGIQCDNPSTEPVLGLISSEWISSRKISVAVLEDSVKITDITTPRAIHNIRKNPKLAHKARECGFTDIDDSTLKSGSPNGRTFTQFIAAHFFNRGFNAIRYGSRLGVGYFCIAVFLSVRFTTALESKLIETVVSISALSQNHSALKTVAKIYGLTLSNRI